MKRLGLAWLAVGVWCCLLMALPASAFTLIVAPARYSVMQVTQDVLRRMPAVLVAYQGDAQTTEPVLHAWNGQDWVPVTLKDFREVNFLQRLPERTILIGGDDVLPRVLLEAASWSPRIDRVSELGTGALINELGRLLQWKEEDWLWFARRYNLTLVDEAAALRETSWYDRTGPLPNRPKLWPGRLKPVKPSAQRQAEPPPVPVEPANPAP